MRHSLLLLPILCLPLFGCNSGDVVEERVTDDNGVISACGQGDGLSACKSYQGAVSNQQMEDEAAQIQNETPAEVEDSVEVLADTPDDYINQDD